MSDDIDATGVTCGRCHLPVDELFDDLTSGRGGSCPRCGSTAGFNVRVEFKPIVVRVEGPEAIFVGRKGPKTVLKGHAKRSRTAAGDLAGTDAWVEQLVDKSFRPGRYQKRVTLAGGSVVKDVEGPLTDQSLHGPQRPPDSSATSV